MYFSRSLAFFFLCFVSLRILCIDTFFYLRPFAVVAANETLRIFWYIRNVYVCVAGLNAARRKCKWYLILCVRMTQVMST